MKDILVNIMYIMIIISFFILTADTVHRMVLREKTIQLTKESIELNRIIIKQYKSKEQK